MDGLHCTVCAELSWTGLDWTLGFGLSSQKTRCLFVVHEEGLEWMDCTALILTGLDWTGTLDSRLPESEEELFCLLFKKRDGIASDPTGAGRRWKCAALRCSAGKPWVCWVVTCELCQMERRDEGEWSCTV
jgi:hypothetical protein